ncbi:MAG: hypothetical protein ACRD21_10865 [Vicinamibacteria bacterium]
MAKLTNAEPLSQEVQREFERLRAAHRLRALTKEESGSGVSRLPSGVYGFTYSPAEDSFPLFHDRDIRTYESHKLEDGSIFLLGFLTPEEKESFEKAQHKSIVHLFPEPKGGADQLVRVPLTRIVSHVESSQRKGTGLELTLAPSH